MPIHEYIEEWMENMVVLTGKLEQMPWRFLLGIKIANRRLPVRCSTSWRMLWSRVSRSWSFALQSTAWKVPIASTVRGTIFEGVTYDLSTIK